MEHVRRSLASSVAMAAIVVVVEDPSKINK
jgi:hypothetical protein